MIYKVSFVVPDDDTHPGGIHNLDHHPAVGEKLVVGNQHFEITEVLVELLDFDLVGAAHRDRAAFFSSCRTSEVSGSVISR